MLARPHEDRPPRAASKLRVETRMTRKVAVMGTQILMTLGKMGMSPLDPNRLEVIRVETNHLPRDQKAVNPLPVPSLLNLQAVKRRPTIPEHPGRPLSEVAPRSRIRISP